MVLPGIVSPPGFFKRPIPTGPAPPVTANLKVHFEMDASIAPLATSWVDEVAGIELIVQPSMLTPSIIAGGTPTGEDYYEFAASEGLGTILLAGEDIPAGGSPRSMYVVCRYSAANMAQFNGVLYGVDSFNDEAWGFLRRGDNDLLAIDFFITLITSTVDPADDTWHVINLVYDDSETSILYFDNSSLSLSGSGTTNTILQSLFINELISNDSGGGVDVAAVLIYAGTHSAGDRLQVFDYLNDKYIGA